MTPRNTLGTITIGAALTMGAVDASVLDEKPVQRIERVAEYNIEAKQIGNVVETTFPWKDQPGLTVKADLGEPTMAERLADKRKRQVVTEVVDFGDGGFKVDILLNEKPDTNRFCYQIEGAENYDFFYQPPLTEEEIVNGAERPPEIEGSYAVYHKTLKNHQTGKENYATGKVMHIPRPQVWSLSSSSTKVWADIRYTDDEGLCVTAPQKFIETATYPVRIDPTFGYTSVGASSGSLDNKIRGSGFVISEAGEMTKLTAHLVKVGTGSTKIKAAIYTSAEVKVVESSTEITSSPASGWRDFTTTAPLFSSTLYDLLVYGNSGGFLKWHGLSYDTTSDVNGIYYSIGSYTSWPASFTPTNEDTTSHFSIYATYTAAEEEASRRILWPS